MHLQAYLNHAVKARKKVGKRERSMYPTFKDFFDYDKELNRLEGKGNTPQVDDMKMKMLSINTEVNVLGGE